MSDARSLTAALGGKWSGGAGIARCPAHEDHSPSLSLSKGADGRLLLHCHAGCAFGDILTALRAAGHLGGRETFRPIGAVLRGEREASERAREEKRARQALALWHESRPIAGTQAEHYLRARGITCALPKVLRFQERCWHQSGRHLPALVSYVGEFPGTPRAIHRIYLDPAGNPAKADVSPNKAMLGPVSRNSVNLFQEIGPLIVAEGIETALSLRCGLAPRPASIWAALSAGGMKALRLPRHAGELIIAPDGDPVGRQAGEALAVRADALGWRVSILAPPEGQDWNDVLRGKAVAR